METAEVVQAMRADTQRIGAIGFEMTRLVADVERQAASLTADMEPKRRRAADRVLGLVAPITDQERRAPLAPIAGRVAVAPVAAGQERAVTGRKPSAEPEASRPELVKKVKEMRKAGETYQAIDKALGHGDSGGWSWRLINAGKDATPAGKTKVKAKANGRRKSGRA